MKDDHIWKEIQNSMAIEGWEISDEALELIKKEYESSGVEKALDKLVAEVGLDAPFEVHKAAWERITRTLRKPTDSSAND